MITINREELKTDPEWSKLRDEIADNHVLPSYVSEELFTEKGRTTEGYCVEALHFAKMQSTASEALHIHYETHNWYDKGRVLTIINSVSIYPSYSAYQAARHKAFGIAHAAGKPSEGLGVNVN